MNVKVFFETLAELYAKQNDMKVSSITVHKKDSLRSS